MRPICSILLAGFAINICLEAQTPLPAQAPQTARQALIEMFLGKGADDFAKHLPESSLHSLIRKDESPETSIVQRISTIGRQMTAQVNTSRPSMWGRPCSSRNKTTTRESS